MAFITFTMGKKNAYFFNSPTHWARSNLPPDVEGLFTKQPPIRDVLELALGDGGTYFVSYRDADGHVLCRHYNLPNPLTDYLYHGHPHIIRDLTTLSLSLGEYESYYAFDKTSASWSNLPVALDKAITSRMVSQDPWKTIWKDNGREAPSFISFGADGTYFMRTVAGGGSWDLSRAKSEGMQGINKFLNDSPNFLNVAGLYLFTSYPTSYILLQTSGQAFSNLPEHTWTDYQKMLPSLPKAFQLPPQPFVPQQPQLIQGQQAMMMPQRTGSSQTSVPHTPIMTPGTPNTPAPPYSQFASPAPRQGSFGYQPPPVSNQYQQYPAQQQMHPQSPVDHSSNATAVGGAAAIGAAALGALARGRHTHPYAHGHHAAADTTDPSQQQQAFDPSQYQQQQTFDPSQYQQPQQTFDPSQFQQQQAFFGANSFDPNSVFQQQWQTNGVVYDSNATLVVQDNTNSFDVGGGVDFTAISSISSSGEDNALSLI